MKEHAVLDLRLFDTTFHVDLVNADAGAVREIIHELEGMNRGIK
jgi:hypothetical protein